jgi:hypothetical protein
MENQPTAAIWRSWTDDLRLFWNDVRVVIMLSRFVSIGQSIAGAEHENGRERDNGSHQHGLCPSLDGTLD